MVKTASSTCRIYIYNKLRRESILRNRQNNTREARRDGNCE